MEHCKKWEAKFTHLLNTNAADEIATLYENIAKVTAACNSKPPGRTPPTSLRSLTPHIPTSPSR